ncbi:MAG: ABC transporter permease [Nitriliruptor sp.]|nr:MAG: ABC transporter permease [Nitriliruptor sp.]
MRRGTTVRLIAAREVRQRLRSKLFVGTTLVIAALLTVLAALPALLGAFDPAEPVVDPSAEESALPRLGVVGSLSLAERTAIEAAIGPIEVVEVADVDAGGAALTGTTDDLVAVVVPGERVLVAPPGQLLRPASVAATRIAEALALGELFSDDPDRVGEVLARPSLPVEEVGDVDPAEATARLVVANLGVVFLFAVLIMYASMIINGVIEEKGSRVVELLVATVPVRSLMTGKLLGLGIVGLLQTLTLFAPPLAVLLLTAGDVIPAGVGGLGVAIAGWFVAGYALYAVMAAGLGSLVSRPEEAQAVLTPANVLMIGGYLVGFLAINAPTSTFAVVASFVPFSAPYAMLVRQALAEPAWWEVALAAALTLSAAAALTVVAARIYEGGILRTGARVRLREAWRAG